MLREVAVLGATGAIGTQALEVIRRQPERYRAAVLAARSNVETLVRLCVVHRPDLAIIGDRALEAVLARRLRAAGVPCAVAAGPGAIVAAASACRTVVIATPGRTGLDACLAAANAGNRLLLGRPELAVVAGPLLRQALLQGQGELIPATPELHATLLCARRMPAGHRPARLRLAASGGPFVGRSRAQLLSVTPAQCGKSGRRAVASASQMHNGLQVIAAASLFPQTFGQIGALLQPQGEVHVLAEHDDGSVTVQAGFTDPRQLLSHALAWSAAASPPPAQPAVRPAIEQPDLATFRCLALACQAVRAGGDAPAILYAAYQVAVDAFLAGALPFLSIADLVEQVLTELPPMSVVDTRTLSRRDRAARQAARQVLRNAC